MTNPDQITTLLKENYSKRYGNKEKHDSPDQARVNMSREVINILKGGISPPRILDIGSGPQAIEKNLLTQKDWKLNLGKNRLFSIDIASISSKKLLGFKLGVSHSQADGVSIPFDSGFFGLVFSNLAIDFMPKEAFGEVKRVLASLGKAIFYFHHPDILTGDLSEETPRNILWRYLKETKALYENSAQIEQQLTSFGFKNIGIKLASDGVDKWWQVKAVNLE